MRCLGVSSLELPGASCVPATAAGKYVSVDMQASPAPSAWGTIRKTNPSGDILDEEGNRINRGRLILYQVDTDPVFATVDKPANEAGTNFPLWKADKARVAVFWPDDNPLPSEQAMGLSTGHPDEEMGNTLFHHSFYVVFQRTNIPENGEDGEGHGGGDSQLSLAETIALIGQSLIIPLNPDAMFFKFAKEKDLGERLSREFDVEHDGKMYRAQIYERGIVYAPIGEWHRTDVIPRTN